MWRSPPDPPSAMYRPDPPYCLSTYSYSGSHDCENWEIESYNREIEDYVNRLKMYVSEAQEFAQEAVTFSEEAFEYAKCEVEDLE